MRQLRRKDREMSENAALEILKTGDYGILSTVSAGCEPYGVPLNYCLVDQVLYFHCALEGYKIENIEKNQKVSFCIVRDPVVESDKFTTRYDSVIVGGYAEEVFKSEKRRGLEALIQKYSLDFIDRGGVYIDRHLERTRVFKILIQGMSGKSKR